MDWQIGWVGKAVKNSNPVMVVVVSSNPTGGNFIILFFKTLDVNIVQKCQICVENKKPECANYVYPY